MNKNGLESNSQHVSGKVISGIPETKNYINESISWCNQYDTVAPFQNFPNLSVPFSSKTDNPDISETVLNDDRSESHKLKSSIYNDNDNDKVYPSCSKYSNFVKNNSKKQYRFNTSQFISTHVKPQVSRM